MAVTYKDEKELQQQTQDPYSGLKGLTENTAQQINKYGQGYQASETVQNAKTQMDNVLAQKPQGFNSKYSGQLDAILQKIQNKGDFKYSINGDALFNEMADRYVNQGRQAMMDTMGKAAALTGGYGNSYGQQVGQQAYQGYIQDLYAQLPQYYNMARQAHQDALGNDKDLYNMLAARESTDYDRYRDEMQDWQGERDYFTNRYDTESDRDYGRYEGERNYWTGLGEKENADYWTGSEFDENVRRYDQDYAEQVRQFNEELAERKRQADLDEAYRRDQFNYQKEQDRLAAELAEAQAQAQAYAAMAAQAASSGGGGGGGGGRTTTPTKSDLAYVNAKKAAANTSSSSSSSGTVANKWVSNSGGTVFAPVAENLMKKAGLLYK